MTQEILNALNIKSMFTNKSADEIINSLKTKEDKINLIDSIIFILNDSRYFQVDTYENNTLSLVLDYLIKSEKWFLEEEENIKKLIKINEDIKMQSDLNRDFESVTYGCMEYEKRSLNKGSLFVPSPSEVNKYLSTDYEIISYIIKNKKIPTTYTSKQIISALSLMCQEYIALLFENPECEKVINDFIMSYEITSLKLKIFHKDELKSVKALMAKYYHYCDIKSTAILINKELTNGNYYLGKKNGIKE